MDKPRITSIYSFLNGMVMVFDQYGRQMPDYQGPLEEVEAKILQDKPADVEWNRDVVWVPRRGTGVR